VIRIALVTAVACLVLATRAHAERMIQVIPELGFPVPARDVGRDQLGVSAGVAIEVGAARHVRGGVEVLYHDWPASPAYKRAMDRYLTQSYGVVIDSRDFAFQATQVSPHVRLLAFPGRRWDPWLQAGMGLYSIRRNLTPADWSGTILIVSGPSPVRASVTAGWNLAVGCDPISSASTSAGIRVAMHSIWSESRPGPFGPGELPAFTAFEAGLHVAFGFR
jgi:hypothetical protein